MRFECCDEALDTGALYERPESHPGQRNSVYLFKTAVRAPSS